MSSFITSHRNQQQTAIQPEWQTINKQRLKRVFHERLKESALNLQVDINNRQLTINSVKKLRLLPDFELLMKVKVTKERQIQVSVNMMKSGNEFSINRNKKQQVEEFLDDICSFCHEGIIKLDKSLQLKYFLSYQIFQMVNFSALFDHFLENIKMIAVFIQYNIYAILFVAGEIDQTFFDLLAQQKIKHRQLQITEDTKQLYQMIKDLLKKKEGTFLYEKQKIPQFNMKKNSPIQQKWTQNKSKESFKVQNNLFKYRKYLHQASDPSINNQKEQVFNEINLKNNRQDQDWQPAGQTNHNKITKNKCKFEFKIKGVSQENPSNISRNLVLKTALDQQAISKCFNQKQIQRSLKGKSCINIAKSYYDQKDPNSIYKDFYQNQSCDQYFQKNKLIPQKVALSILSGIIQGARFLRDCSNVHNRLDFSNVFLDSNLVPKIDNFGDAYNENINNQRSIRFSFPYTSHEQFSSPNEKPKNSRDTYSLGVMLDKILMSTHILPNRNHEELIKKLTQKSYPTLMSFLPERYFQIFPPRMARLILTIVLLCMHPEPSKQPNQDIIRIVLENHIESFKFLSS